MKVSRLSVSDFRNIENCELDLSDGINLLSGENAQGKTNAVEAIYLFARGKSFRKCKDGDMIRFGQEGFRLSLTYSDRSGETELGYNLFGNERKRTRNGYKIEKISEMIGSFRAVLFTPDHLGMVKDGPEERRNFLDVAVSQIKPYYIKVYSDYKKALEERNCLLRMRSRGLPVDPEELEAWSDSLAGYAVPIWSERRDYVRRLSDFAPRLMEEISDGREKLELSYESDLPEDTDPSPENLREAFRRVFRENIQREIAAGTTLSGITRDDLGITLNGKSARSYASQGQQRSIVLALKLSEGEVCRQITGEYPVFLFDDVLSELDEKRKAFILRNRDQKQLIITSCEPSLPGISPKTSYHVSGGVFRQKT